MLPSNSSPLWSSLTKSLRIKQLVLTLLLLVIPSCTTAIIDNTCTFRIDGKLFTLAFLNQNKPGTPGYYQLQQDEETQVYFNFCEPFLPPPCRQANLSSAYSYVVLNNDEEEGNPQITCLPYSSDSKTSYFTSNYTNQKGHIQLNLTMQTQLPNLAQQRTTTFLLDCEPSDKSDLTNIKVTLNEGNIEIRGQSPEACPVFELSSLWEALQDNQLIFGIVLFIVGFVMLFYGILMTHLMIFLTSYFLTFAVLASILSAFLTPESSRIAIYFSLLLIIFLSTLVAYGLTKLVNVSVFFIGAFLGFILGALVNTIFCKVFDLYSVWSLVVFEVLFTIPLGLLTFKYSEQIIVLSTSLAGSYMVVRPISWIFGGYPNEFTLYQAFQHGQLKTLPWTFFLYLILILAIFALGGLYQLSKIQKRHKDATHVSYLPESVENHLDYIHQHLGKLLSQQSPSEDKNEDYQAMKQMGTLRNDKSKDGKGQQVLIDKKNKDEDF